MQTVTPAFLTALTGGHDVVSTVTHFNPYTSVSTVIDVADGSVALDVTQFCRRTLSLTLPNRESVFQVLNVPGSELTVQSGIRYGSTVELVPAGVYRIDEQSIALNPSGDLTLTCPDRSVVLQRSRLGASRASTPSNLVWQEIKALVEGAFTSSYAPFPGWATGSPDQSATAKVGAVVYDDGQRDGAISQYCTDNSLELFANASGLFVLRKIPTVAGLYGTWLVAFGANGILIDGNRDRSLADTKNAIVLTTTATDIQMAAVEVANTNNPLVDPLSTLGALGFQRFDYAGNFRSTAQATAAGNTLLAQKSAVQQQVSATAITNAALDGWDQIQIIGLPSDLGNTVAESHVVQSYTMPLNNKANMAITGRAVIPT